jgi:hypothetical protein
MVPSLGFIRNSEAVSTIVHKEVYDIIKEELKEKLKVRTTIEFPHTFSDGYLKTEVIYDDEVIHENTQTINSGSMAFSF